MAKAMWSALLGVGTLTTLLGWLLTRASTRFRVTNRSMLPTLKPGDRILVNRLAFRFRPPRRGEIVVFRHPQMPRTEAIKRLIGLPGERVTSRAGVLFINGTPLDEPYLLDDLTAEATAEWRLGSDEYLVFGDNRAQSRDSRDFGPISGRSLQGPAWYRYWPRDARSGLRID